MKKKIVTIVIAAMMLCCVACGKEAEEPSKSTSSEKLVLDPTEEPINTPLPTEEPTPPPREEDNTLYVGDITGVMPIAMTPVDGVNYTSDTYKAIMARFVEYMNYTDGQAFTCSFIDALEGIPVLLGYGKFEVTDYIDGSAEYPFRTLLVTFDDTDYWVVTESFTDGIIMVQRESADDDYTQYQYKISSIDPAYQAELEYREQFNLKGDIKGFAQVPMAPCPDIDYTSEKYIRSMDEFVEYKASVEYSSDGTFIDSLQEFHDLYGYTEFKITYMSDNSHYRWITVLFDGKDYWGFTESYTHGVGAQRMPESEKDNHIDYFL